jgi:glyoxylase-like metal-dependent hydrolase (beta-lactamase superfamily II)
MLTVKSFEFNPVQENTYVLFTQKDACCIIDPGCYFPGERVALQEFVEQQGLSPILLLNTHCHLDHVFGNKFVYDTWDLPLHLHENELPVLTGAPEWGLRWSMPFENYRGEHVFLTPGERISIGEDKLTVLFLPGHSPGSVGFYAEKEGFIIGGDVLFREGIGRTDFPGGDHATLMSSIREQLFTLPDETIIYPGHGEPTTIGHEKAHNPFVR